MPRWVSLIHRVQHGYLDTSLKWVKVRKQCRPPHNTQRLVWVQFPCTNQGPGKQERRAIYVWVDNWGRECMGGARFLSALENFGLFGLLICPWTWSRCAMHMGSICIKACDPEVSVDVRGVWDESSVVSRVISWLSFRILISIMSSRQLSERRGLGSYCDSKVSRGVSEPRGR